MKAYNPAAPIHRGWDSYRSSTEEVRDGANAETSLERAMRLRREFLDALEECGATAAQGCSLFEGQDISVNYVVLGTCPGDCIERATFFVGCVNIQALVRGPRHLQSFLPFVIYGQLI